MKFCRNDIFQDLCRLTRISINTNMHKSCFWLLCFLIERPHLMNMIREETAPAFESQGGMDFYYLANNCPQLIALFYESVRVTAGSQAVRQITNDTVVDGKLLRKGHRIIVPFRQLHIDEDAWGPNPQEFDEERFLRDERLSRSSNYRPWGGGSTVCPGKYLSKLTVLSFTALLLRKFDMELEEFQKIPGMEMTRPSLGIMAKQSTDDDPQVILTPRQ